MTKRPRRSERPKGTALEARSGMPGTDGVPILGPDDPGRIDVLLPKWALVYMVDEAILNMFADVRVADACIEMADMFILEYAIALPERLKARLVSVRSNLSSERERLRLRLENRILAMKEGIGKRYPNLARGTDPRGKKWTRGK